jgi:hypothetical protein
MFDKAAPLNLQSATAISAFPHAALMLGMLPGPNPDVSHFRFRSADFDPAFSVIANPKPAASRRSGMKAFRAGHELSGLVRNRGLTKIRVYD